MSFNGKNKGELLESDVLAIFENNGSLGLHLPNYEIRQQQVEMVRKVIGAYNNNHIAMLEAGTGTGKSLAYLIPAVLWSLLHGQPTVIATHTINLQQQLLEKDIPLIKKALGLDFQASLVKGMHNYICLRRLKDLQKDDSELKGDEKDVLVKLLGWCDRNNIGSKTELGFMPSYSIWNKVCVEMEACNNVRCPCYKECYFFQARRHIKDSQILIANHHLLFADLVSKMSSEGSKGSILPKYNNLILDEAHNVEEVATEHFGDIIEQRSLKYLLRRIFSEDDYAGKINQLRVYLQKNCAKRQDVEVIKLFNYIDIDLKSALIGLNQTLEESFDEIIGYVRKNFAVSSSEKVDFKLRVIESHRNHSLWQESIVPSVKNSIRALLNFIEEVISLGRQVRELKYPQLRDSLANIMLEIEGLNSKLLQAAGSFRDVFLKEYSDEDVSWIEVVDKLLYRNVRAVTTKIDISKELSTELFQQLDTTVLCSATMTTNNNFKFMQGRLGIDKDMIENKEIISEIFPSPFNYGEQVLFLTPEDMPSPKEEGFFNKLVENLEIIIKSCRGNAFVLFTSYNLMNRCYKAVKKSLDKRFKFFLQGEGSRQTLLEEFVENDYSVLFGTDSFWEGVDVAGDALRCVIIIKLPFRVPDEPVIQARTEYIDKNGGNSFMEYSVPMAITKFKQGFGRLIRHRQDRGAIICLDSRINNKTYGRMFLKSLPGAVPQKIKSNELSAKIKSFFRKKS